MPRTKKTVSLSELRVGLLVLVSIAVLIFLVLNASGDINPFSKKLHLKARFIDANGLREGSEVRAAMNVIEQLVTIEPVLDIPAVRMHTIEGFETAVFPYTTDVPLLTNWGTPLLLGPGSILVAHTDDEHVAIDELNHAVELYERIARQLLIN